MDQSPRERQIQQHRDFRHCPPDQHLLHKQPKKRDPRWTIFLFRVDFPKKGGANFYSLIDAVSSGEHPVLIQDTAAATVVEQVLQGHKGGVLTLGCVGAVYDAVLSDRLLKFLRQGCIK
jgi:hypothetical protein